jgi:hypothetical protein
MKFSLKLAGCLLLPVASVSAHAISAEHHAHAHTERPQNPKTSSPPTSSPSKVDASKEADIRRLLDLVGTKALLSQTFDEMTKSLRPVLANSLPPGDYRDRLIDLFLAKFTAKENVQQFLELAVPVYDKNFSHQEIRSLIEFYQTPLGQKTISVLPKVTLELQEEGRKWGENLGRKAMMDVLSEHPELADALNAAQSGSAPTKQ